ncbi:MAG: SoxR reducing system RseC family protein [Sulfuritalea sp.]|jgi:positive regulator of sigma E activity|nr:SoxR reducing system RseC family protein [Sulfuritalea sp.]
MSRCEATVVAVKGHEVWVEVPERAPSCGNCKTVDACQTGLLGRGSGPRRYLLENRIGAGVGDHVQLTVADGTVWRASLLSYVLPLLLAIGAAAIGQFAAGDSGAVIGTLAGIGCGLLLLRRSELRARGDASLFSLQIESLKIRTKEQS